MRSFTDLPAAKPSTVGWICVLLVLAVIAAYCPVVHCAFVDYDDGDYVRNNPEVLKGLSWSGVAWAFTHFYASNWHPLTWLSHMLDVQLFGLNAGGHHATNVLFHAANTVLVFLWLKRATRLVWRSAFVAALFGLHPLHVESVAWVAERKDVLSTFFGLLTLMAYTRYAQRSVIRASSSDQPPPPDGFHIPSSIHYLLAIGCFALGLLSKPMLVTLPFVLLLLDYWPLNRMRHSQSAAAPTDSSLSAGGEGRGEVDSANSPFAIRHSLGLLLEKIPFFLLSAASCVLTYLAQHAGKSMMATTVFPVSSRIQNAFISYALYLGKMVWPDNLAAYYPLYYPIATEALVMAVFALLLLTAGVCVCWRSRPYLVTGWLWYLGMLVPVIGLLQVGGQAMADRYTYVPLLGVFIALTWLVAEISRHWPLRRLVLAILAVVMLAVCLQLTAAQVRYWQDSETLARHSLVVTTENNAPMQVLLGNALIEQRNFKEAAIHLAQAVKATPEFIQARHDLSVALVNEARLDDAADICRETLKIYPRDFKSHYLLANIFLTQGKWADTIAQYHLLLRDDSEQLLALNNLAWLLATAPDASVRNGNEAVRLAEKACRLTNYERPVFMGTLAAAYADAGRFDEAVTTAQKAVALATATRSLMLIKNNRDMLELYQHQKAYHQPASH